MRKIHFNEQTILEIKNYIASGHTIEETCNRFTLKRDTLKRVMRENDIKPYFKEKINNQAYKLDSETINLVCNLFKHTDTRLKDISIEAGIQYWVLQDILESNFTQEEIDQRKAKLYRKSKMGDNNPMTSRYKEKHPNYKGEVEDGKGYLMRLKPDWYTGRAGCNHVFSHHVIICEALGLTQIPQGFCVHHIDGNKKNNDISNLALMQMGGHTKLHQLQNELSKVQRLSDME